MSVTEIIDGEELSIKQESEDLFSVVNFSRPDLSEHRYIVATDDATTHAIYCTCPHHRYRDATCKHMRAVQAAINRGVFEQDDGQDNDLPEKLERYLSAGGITAEEAAGIASNQF
jgi:predicted nucleic acid-binding Zn finger protein